MPVEWVVAYDRATGRKLPNRVPRSYLDRYPNLSETPASRKRWAPKKTATPASEATTPKENYDGSTS